jgi:CCR4-NOT transcription complex subunit 6
LSYLGNELEVMGNVRNLSPILWTLSQLTVLYLNDNQLTRLPSEIACLTNLVTLDLSNNKLRNLPSEIGMPPLIYRKSNILANPYNTRV